MKSNQHKTKRGQRERTKRNSRRKSIQTTRSFQEENSQIKVMKHNKHRHHCRGVAFFQMSYESKVQTIFERGNIIER